MKLDLIGLTNALTDITFKVSDDELKDIGVEKGSYTPFRKIDKTKFSEILKGKEFEYSVAGSPANVIINASKLGLKTGLFASLGYDEKGDRYIKFLEERNIIPFIYRSTDESGFCYIMISPDGERTNTTQIGAAEDFYFKFKNMKGANFLHTSGYELVTNPDKFKEGVEYAKKHNVKLSFDLADKIMVRRQKEYIENLLDKVDILFATEAEANELTGESPRKSLELLSKVCPIVSLKRGKEGSIVKSKNEEYEIKPYPVKVINKCGAGDAYAAGFLFGHLRGFSLEKSGNMGSYIASRVCASNESHL